MSAHAFAFPGPFKGITGLCDSESPSVDSFGTICAAAVDVTLDIIVDLEARRKLVTPW